MTHSAEHQEFSEFIRNSYLNYSMYVIHDRSLPSITDGLKPVQRRIVYAMHELHLNHTAKYKKAARTVGDVLGKYHPHGDTACYEAMVLMAQPFSYRYPLINGQGNWGAPDDPHSFAAMRYTECRMTKYSLLLLSELGKGNVDFVPNFDGTLQEPVFLPAQAPNILLNSVTGIAVGMATDIPPHNLKEVIEGTIAILKKQVTSTAGLMEHIRGPDYPTGCEIITPKAELQKIYETGRGSITGRATYFIEDDTIVITKLPYQASNTKIIQQIASQMLAKQLPKVIDIRDESDAENPVRIAIVMKSKRVDFDITMSHLFATTDLEKSYRVNMNMIGLDNKPKVKNLFSIISEWLEFRRDTVVKRLRFELEKIEQRLHLIEGLQIAYLNLDEVIRIIREDDEPKASLIEKFNLSEIQANAILDTKLRNLAKLEENKLNSEASKFQKEADRLNGMLSSNVKLKNLIAKDLQSVADEHGDERRSHIVERTPSKKLSDEELISSEPITIILSQKGWIKAGKGHNLDLNKVTFKSGDKTLHSIEAKTNEHITLIGTSGRAYTISVHDLPNMKSAGEPLTKRLNLLENEKIQHALKTTDENVNYIIASDAGLGFICHAENLVSRAKAGKPCLTLGKDDNPIAPAPFSGTPKYCIAITTLGRMLVFNLQELPTPKSGKGKGVRIINIPALNFESGERLLAVKTMDSNQKLIVHSGKRKISFDDEGIQKFYSRRGRKGANLPRGFTNPHLIEVE